MKVELDLSNYATKADLKSPAGIDTSGLAKKNVWIWHNYINNF